MTDSLEFVNNQMMCEWVYVLDLDTEVLEVYATDHGIMTFVDLGIKAHKRFEQVGGGQIALLRTFGLAELPGSEKEFLAELEPPKSENDGQD